MHSNSDFEIRIFFVWTPHNKKYSNYETTNTVEKYKKFVQNQIVQNW